MIQVRDIEFRYREGDFALRIPELSIEHGSAVAVIGPSGSGKTTLLNLLAGVAVPQRGRITVDGVEVAGLSDAARRGFRIRRIGMVFQEFELLEYLNVLDNILLPCRISDALKLDAPARERAVELAGRVGIGDKLRSNVNRLSHGEKQRVGVCRALLAEPALLLADEPTGNLDPANKSRVLEILLDYAGRHGATLLTVTHDHGLLDRFDRVIDFEDFHRSPRVAPGGGRS